MKVDATVAVPRPELGMRAVRFGLAAALLLGTPGAWGCGAKDDGSTGSSEDEDDSKKKPSKGDGDDKSADDDDDGDEKDDGKIHLTVLLPAGEDDAFWIDQNRLGFELAEKRASSKEGVTVSVLEYEDDKSLVAVARDKCRKSGDVLIALDAPPVTPLADVSSSGACSVVHLYPSTTAKVDGAGLRDSGAPPSAPRLARVPYDPSWGVDAFAENIADDPMGDTFDLALIIDERLIALKEELEASVERHKSHHGRRFRVFVAPPGASPDRATEPVHDWMAGGDASFRVCAYFTMLTRARALIPETELCDGHKVFGLLLVLDRPEEEPWFKDYGRTIEDKEGLALGPARYAFELLTLVAEAMSSDGEGVLEVLKKRNIALREGGR